MGIQRLVHVADNQPLVISVFFHLLYSACYCLDVKAEVGDDSCQCVFDVCRNSAEVAKTGLLLLKHRPICNGGGRTSRHCSSCSGKRGLCMSL